MKKQVRMVVYLIAPSRAGQTNSQGYYTIDQVPVSSQERVQFDRAGYVPTTKITRIEKGQGIFIEANIGAFESTKEVNGGTGGTVTTTDGGAATIEANSLVDGQGRAYTGAVAVSITTFDPTKDTELNAFPGRFEGVAKTGETIPFITFGFMDVTVTGGGAALQLASGKTATLRIPVPESIRSAAPATLPQWYFNPADGKWHEEGVFTLKGNYYEGTIPHFSIWNCDVGAARCTIRGRVVDNKGQPVHCAKVTMENLGPRGRFTSGEYCTPSDGTFAIPVDANSTVRYWAEKGGTKSDPQQTDTCVNGGERNIGDIILGTIPVKITLTWGKDPEDIDSHLAIPKASGTGWEHLYYSRPKTKVEDAMLDTDDVDSFGPEITSIYLLHKGSYRFSVHHFDGSGTLTTSGANVSLIVEGRGIFEFKPPAGGTSAFDLWKVFDLVVDQSGNLSINTINEIVHNVLPTDDASFFPAN
jgi:hypothetical protein